jgi:hypothetical protein
VRPSAPLRRRQVEQPAPARPRLLLHRGHERSADADPAESLVDDDRIQLRRGRVVLEREALVQRRDARDDAVDLRDENPVGDARAESPETRRDVLDRCRIPELAEQQRDSGGVLQPRVPDPGSYPTTRLTSLPGTTNAFRISPPSR